MHKPCFSRVSENLNFLILKDGVLKELGNQSNILTINEDRSLNEVPVIEENLLSTQTNCIFIKKWCCALSDDIIMLFTSCHYELAWFYLS